MPGDSDAEKLEQSGTESHFIDHDDETAGKDFERAGDIRDRLGDDDAHSAEYWENPAPPQQPNPDLVRENRCKAAREYMRAAGDYLTAATMLDAAGKGAAAAKLRQKAAAAARKGIKWFEACLDRDLEAGELTRRLKIDYTRLAEFFDLLELPEDAKRARAKADLVDRLRRQAAEEAQKELEKADK